jgi:prevent-host-death family protein
MEMFAGFSNRNKNSILQRVELSARIYSFSDAKSEFREMIATARLSPVAITKYGKPFVVIMAADEYFQISNVDK